MFTIGHPGSGKQTHMNMTVSGKVVDPREPFPSNLERTTTSKQQQKAKRKECPWMFFVCVGERIIYNSPLPEHEWDRSNWRFVIYNRELRAGEGGQLAAAQEHPAGGVGNSLEGSEEVPPITE